MTDRECTTKHITTVIKLDPPYLIFVTARRTHSEWSIVVCNVQTWAEVSNTAEHTSLLRFEIEQAALDTNAGKQ